MSDWVVTIMQSTYLAPSKTSPQSRSFTFRLTRVSWPLKGLKKDLKHTLICSHRAQTGVGRKQCPLVGKNKIYSSVLSHTDFCYAPCCLLTLCHVLVLFSSSAERLVEDYMLLPLYMKVCFDHVQLLCLHYEAKVSPINCHSKVPHYSLWPCTVVPSVFSRVCVLLLWLTVLFILLYDVTFHLVHFPSQVVHTVYALCFSIEGSFFLFCLSLVRCWWSCKHFRSLLLRVSDWNPFDLSAKTVLHFSFHVS